MDTVNLRNNTESSQKNKINAENFNIRTTNLSPFPQTFVPPDIIYTSITSLASQQFQNINHPSPHYGTASAIQGDGTVGIFKKAANAITLGNMYPTTLPAHQQESWSNKLRALYDGDNPIQNTADIETYTETPLFSSDTITHGDVFSTSEIASALLGGTQTLKAVSQLPKFIKELDFNYQGVPKDLIKNVAIYTNKSRSDVEAMYSRLEKNHGINYNKYIDNFVKENSDGVTKKDAHYIFAYTSDLFYEKMNSELRTTGKLATSTGKKIYDKLISALDKLPDEAGTYYRHLENLTEEIAEAVDIKYAKNNVIKEKGFLSATDAPNQDYQNGISRTFVINANKSAKDISQITLNTELAPKIGATPMKKEVIIIPEVNVKVTDDNNGTFHLNIME